MHGLLLPGLVPEYSRTDIKLLPSSVSKRGIWKEYQVAMTAAHKRAAAYRTFCRQWQTLLPSLVIMTPMSDLCWTCQQNSAAVQRATSSDVEKSAALPEYLDHLSMVTLERSNYTTVLKEFKDSIAQHFTINGTLTPPPLYSKAVPNSVPIKAHYSFDYAQQVSGK